MQHSKDELAVAMEGGALLAHSIAIISCKNNPSHLSRTIPIQRPRLLQKPCTTTTNPSLVKLPNKRARVQTWIRARQDPLPETDSGLGESEEEKEELVEELECLEKEAIAGEDEGRAPADYDRRAHIFDESSKVFRALKDGGAAGERRQEDNDEHV